MLPALPPLPSQRPDKERELWSIYDPDSDLYFKVINPETREKAATIREEFFSDLKAKQKALKPLPRKTRPLAERKPPTA
jgi:hypothetical protein